MNNYLNNVFIFAKIYMIIDFSVGNFRSIKEVQSLDLSADSIRSKDKSLDEQNVHKSQYHKGILKSKVLYGANASGKSNMIVAFEMFQNIVNNSFKDESILRQIDSFRLSTETAFKPSFFQLTFIHEKECYRYGFEADIERIHTEWLFKISKTGKSEKLYFTRDKDDFSIDPKFYSESPAHLKPSKRNSNALISIVRPNALLLSTSQLFLMNIAKPLVEEINKIVVITWGKQSNLFYDSVSELEDSAKKEFIMNLLRRADTGIENIDKREFNSSVGGKEEKFSTVLTSHSIYDGENQNVGTTHFFMSLEESEGTKRLFELGPKLCEAFNQGKTLVIDEFDSRFHPLLSRNIVELFNNASNKNAQLVVATHDVNLLNRDFLRRDQICFVEKDSYGGSHFYSLSDITGVRNDSSYAKEYITGRYGAIPFLGDFHSILD